MRFAFSRGVAKEKPIFSNHSNRLRELFSPSRHQTRTLMLLMCIRIESDAIYSWILKVITNTQLWSVAWHAQKSSWLVAREARYTFGDQHSH